MRPHVELIDQQDLIWHPAELEGGAGTALQQNFAYDEEDGSVSARIRFESDWSRPAGVQKAQVEWYVLKGEVRFGDEVLGEGDYWMTPGGHAAPALRAKAGTEILYFREFGDWRFTMGGSSDPALRADQVPVLKRTTQMDWIDVKDGSPMRFDLGGTPVPGLYIKMLFRDSKTGFYTRLIKAKPNWVEHPLAHHPVYEEAYCLEGSFHYNFGTMWPGTYFFRPALVRHGDFTAGDQGTVWIVRCDGDLVDWYTDNGRMEMKGDPQNWGPGFPHTVAPMPIQPVRSRSIGKMEDPYYS